jgi:hypothetical protein
MSFTSKRCWRGCRWIWQGATGSGDMGQSLAWPPRAQSQPRPQHAVTCETLQRAFGDALQARVRRRAYDARNAKFTCRMVGKVGPAASVASVGVCAALIPWLEAFSVSKRCARARRSWGVLRQLHALPSFFVTGLTIRQGLRGGEVWAPKSSSEASWERSQLRVGDWI